MRKNHPTLDAAGRATLLSYLESGRPQCAAAQAIGMHPTNVSMAIAAADPSFREEVKAARLKGKPPPPPRVIKVQKPPSPEPTPTPELLRPEKDTRKPAPPRVVAAMCLAAAKASADTWAAAKISTTPRLPAVAGYAAIYRAVHTLGDEDRRAVIAMLVASEGARMAHDADVAWNRTG